MPFQMRYARVDSAGEQPHVDIRPTATPLQYSDSLSDPTSPPLTAQWTSKKSFLGSAYTPSPTTTESLPPYRDYGEDPGRPSKPQRSRTTGSFISVASSAWKSTREFAVSSFNVPQLAAPWDHELKEKSPGGPFPSSTVREFDHRRQRRRLFVNSAFQLVITTTLCGGLAAALYGFSTIITGLTQPQKKGFNALITGLSIILGLNLASSLKSYAQMMRWRFLASSYRTLQDFELVMQCESQSKAFRLLWAGRTRGQWYPNKTQVLAFLWLAINIALQVAAALLGLTYSIDISEQYTHLIWGEASVADLSTFQVSTALDNSFLSQSSTANNYGITGQDCLNLTSTLDSGEAGQRVYYLNDDMTEYWYTFIDRSPVDWSENVITPRQIISRAQCMSLPVTFGGYAGFDVATDDDGRSSDSWIHFTDAAGVDTPLYVAEAATGSTTWIAYMDTTGPDMLSCGPRCAYMYALQSADNSTVLEPALFQCNNTISQITNIAEYYNASVYDMADEQAHILAGAIAWSGHTIDSINYQANAYPPYSMWSPLGGASALDIGSLLMRFSSGAIAAYDYGGTRLNVTDQWQPSKAQVVKVEWGWAAIVLGVIPVTQGIVLLLVIGWANKAVIKDTSFLATARLLRPVVDKLGDRGCLLTGDEIAEELGNYRITYGPRFPKNMGPGQEADVVKHMDLIAEDEGLHRWHGRMPAGRYDGMSSWCEKEEEMELGVIDVREERERMKRRARRGSV